MVRIAPVVAKEIRNAPAELKNLGEYTKRQICWHRVSALDIEVPKEIDSYLISESEVKYRGKSARKEGNIYQEMQMAKLTMACIPVAENIRNYSRKHGFLTPKSDRILSKIANARLPLSQTELKVFGKLCGLLGKHGFELPDPDA